VQERKRSGKSREARAQVSGPRARIALAVGGYSLRDAVAALKRQGTRLSVAGLGKIVAAPGIVTTRKSVRDAIAGICGVASDWLAGFGPERSVLELVAYRLAGGFWDEDHDLRAGPPAKGPVEAVRKIDNLMQRLEGNRKERAGVLADVLNLDHWIGLLGDSRPAEISDEAREAFAVHLGRALAIATTRPILGETNGARQPQPSSAGILALRHCLNPPAR
jgi:hypothetical protein